MSSNTNFDSSRACCSALSKSWVHSTGDSFLLDDALIDVAPAPSFSWFERPNNSVMSSMKMFGGVMVFRTIATADVAANQAFTQMYPCIAHL
jgi:hypothetical protein